MPAALHNRVTFDPVSAVVSWFDSVTYAGAINNIESSQDYGIIIIDNIMHVSIIIRHLCMHTVILCIMHAYCA